MVRRLPVALCLSLLALVLPMGAGVAVAAAVLGSGACPSTVSSTNYYCYHTSIYRWQNGVGNLTYAFGADLTQRDRDAASQAIGAWNSTPTRVQFHAYTSADGANPSVTFHSESRSDRPRGTMQPQVLNGYYTRTDVYINDLKVDSDTTLERQAVAAHEVGHALGLDHTWSPGGGVSDESPFIPNFQVPVNHCNYVTLMQDGGRGAGCVTMAGSPTSCSLSESAMHGQWGPWVDEFAGIDALYGATGKPYPAGAPCRPTMVGALVDYTAVNMRSGPGTTYGIIATLSVGTSFSAGRFQLDSSGRSWVNIRLRSGTTGWIASWYAKFQTGDVITTASVYMRNRPDTAGTSLGVLDSGTYLVVTNSAVDALSRTWLSVCVDANLSLCGWVSAWNTKGWSL